MSKRESSLDRVLRILDLFSEHAPAHTADQIGASLTVSRSTLYRYLKTLSDSGYLAPGAGATYTLGPRIIEHDRSIRRSDPLLRFGRAELPDLLESFTGLVLLTRFYGERVLCVDQASNDPSIVSSMERGRPFDLFYGSPSRIILAHLPSPRLRAILADHGPAVARAGLGDSWPELRDRLRAIRRDGVYVGYGEIDPGLVGVAAPIFRAPRAILGSICLVVPHWTVNDERLALLKETVMATGTRISERVMGEAAG